MKGIRAFLKRAERREGFALTEMILAVLVLAGMLIVAWNLYGRIRDQSTVNATKQYLLNAVGKIQGLFNGSDYGGLADITAPQQVKTGIWPKDYLKGSNLQNGWGGEVNVAPDDDKASFSITMSGLPSGACVELAASGNEWKSISINGTPVWNNSMSQKLSAGTASTNCTQDGSGTTGNSVTWSSF